MNVLAWVCFLGVGIAAGLIWFTGTENRSKLADRYAAQISQLQAEAAQERDANDKAIALLDEKLAEMQAELEEREAELATLSAPKVTLNLAESKAVQPAVALPVTMRVPYTDFLKMYVLYAIDTDLKSDYPFAVERIEEFEDVCERRADGQEPDAKIAASAVKLVGYLKKAHAERQRLQMEWQNVKPVDTGYRTSNAAIREKEEAESIARQRKNVEAEWKKVVSEGKSRIIGLTKDIIGAEEDLAKVLDTPTAFGAFNEHPNRKLLLDEIASTEKTIDTIKAQVRSLNQK